MGAVEGQHRDHAGDEAQRDAGHCPAAKADRRKPPGRGDAHAPKDQQVDKSRVADFAQAVQVVHNAVEHRIAPGERQHHKNIPLGHRQHRGVPGEKAEHRPPERREQQPAGQRERPAAQRDAQRAFAQAVGQAGAEVLAGKDRSRAGKRSDRNISQRAELACHRTPGHKHRALGIVKRLQQQVPEGVQRIVQPKRHPHMQNFTQGFAVMAGRQHREPQFRHAAEKVQDAERPGQHHGGRRGKRRAANPQAKPADKRQIADNIDHAADHQHPERSAAVAKPAQDAGVEVVPHVAKAAQRCDAQVDDCAVPRIGRDLHEPQKQRPQQQAQHGQRQGRGIQQPDRRAGQFPLAVCIVPAGRLRNQDGNARPDAKKDAQQDLKRLGTGCHRRKRRCVAIIADDQRVNGTV